MKVINLYTHLHRADVQLAPLTKPTKNYTRVPVGQLHIILLAERPHSSQRSSGKNKTGLFRLIGEHVALFRQRQCCMPAYFVYMTRFSIPRDPGLYERCRPREQTYQFDVKLKDEGIFSLNSF